MVDATLYLPYISPTSPLYLTYISPISPRHLPDISQVGGSSWSMRRQCVSVTDTLSPDITISLDCSSGSELEHAVGGFGRSFRRRDARFEPQPYP